jgi:TonB-linked SusC/RagA family outer membrane protein
MTTMITMNRVRAIAGAVLSVALTMPTTVAAQAQGAVITGKVTAESGQPLQGANVFITELAASVGANNDGVFTINVPSARVMNQQVTVRVRAIGFTPDVRLIRVTPGSQTVNFTLKQDVNRLSEVVVTGIIGEGLERAKVPFAIGRLTSEEMPVPALDPIRGLQGKVAGVRVASTNGQPGSEPEILLRGPTSINATGRSQQPLIILDGAIMRVGLSEIGGMDIESIEVVKGAAGASLYGSQAASGVITIKTKRGGTQDGVKFSTRSEYGFSDLNSLDYGQPINHPLQLDETGKRFCLVGTSNTAPCSRTINWMAEIMRINNVAGDTIRTQQSVQWNAPSLGGGDLTNLFQSHIWPEQYYNTFAQVASRNPILMNSVDATGRVGGVRFYVSGQYTDNQGAVKGLNGQQQKRGRVNLDYDIRSDLLVSVSTMYDKGTTDINSGGATGANFGALLRGAPPGTDYMRRDTLGRGILKGGGTGFRPTGNGGGNFGYDSENAWRIRTTNRFLGNLTTTYFPAEWVTVEGSFAYDTRQRLEDNHTIKGYRTETLNATTNNGVGSLGNQTRETMNGSLSATFRKRFSDLNTKVRVSGLYDQDHFLTNNSGGQIFIVKDVYTLSNTSTNKTATSTEQTDKNMGLFAGASADYKDRYIVDGTFRYDGSSRFGAGNRWAPFGRLSAVWRVSEEAFWNVPNVNDFRLRASRGTAGNTPSFEAQYETYSCSTTGCSLGQAGNSQLKPETTTETELGTDFTLFDRLGIEITHARSATKNQILNVPTPAALGFTTQWQNAGTLENKTWEVGVNVPIVNKKDFNWSMRSTWDRTRTFVTELFMPEYYTNGGTGQGTGSLMRITASRDIDTLSGMPLNRYGNIWGRHFYRACGELPASVRAQCGEGQAYQVNDEGWVVWVGQGNSYRDGITRNLWQTKLPASDSPWNYQLNFGHPIVDRPLRGEVGEGTGKLHILGNSLPDFRLTWSHNVQYKRLSLYALLDGTFGHEINNQGEQWGLLDLGSANFDQSAESVETAKPVGYSWRAAGAESGNLGTGGFYDILGPNNYSVESGSYAKLREVSLTYRVGQFKGLGDWTVGLIARNLATFTKYSGYDPETGVSGGQAQSGLINQTDAFDFPTLRQFTFTVSTRF